MYRCLNCGHVTDRLGPEGDCPACGAAGLAPLAERADDLVIDVTARAAGEPTDDPASPHVQARPVFEDRHFAGRVFPGGPFFQGRTVVFRAGGPGEADGRGCCGCGCLLLALLGLVFLRGCASFF